MNKALDFLEWVIEKILSLLFLICLLIGIYGLYDSYRIYISAADNSLLNYKPGYETGEEPEKEIKGNMVAWITIEGTTVDYPVMQGDDNFEFLDKDPYGDYSLSGSIFLDSRNAEDFSDRYSLVYGHHMEGGLMFGALDDYLDEDFFQEHQNVELTVDGRTYFSKAYAVLETSGTEQAMFAPTETDVEETIEFIKKNALFYDRENEPKNSSRILALSTCKYPDTAERTIVLCSF